MLLAPLAALGAFALRARAATLTIEAYDAQGRALAGQALLEHIAPVSRRGHATPGGSGVFVTDLYDSPAQGRPWISVHGAATAISWRGPRRVRVSLPWPIAGDGFSTVSLDNGGDGYEDGARVLLNEAVAETEYRLFQEAAQERASSWEPNYRPSAKERRLRAQAEEAMAAAKREASPAKRAALYEKALGLVSAAWGKMLFEHGAQVAADRKLGPSLRWGLTLDETLAGRAGDFDALAKRLAGAGANWVRLVFRANSGDFTYAKPASFSDYDAAVDALTKRKLHILGSPLDSTMWPPNLEPRVAAARVRDIVLRYKESIRSWDVASEINGDWLGGMRHPLPEDVVLRCAQESAAAVKRIDPSLETVATLYWWEGTAGDDVHPTFAWLKRVAPTGLFKQIDVAALSVYPDDNPFGLAFDPAFRKLHQYLPRQQLMLGAFGYVEGRTLQGYWWYDPADVDDARKDLMILYTGAAPASPSPLGGGFWWQTLATMTADAPGGDSFLNVYRRTLERLGR